jgi:hypothetical protein
MSPLPASAIQPLRDRLAHLRAQDETPELTRAIRETEALIKRLENPNAPRSP